jgi:hypothetical protein
MDGRCLIRHWFSVGAQTFPAQSSLIRYLAPAAGAVEDEIVVFHSNFLGDKTEYQGPPTDEVDAAWEALYDGTF